MEERRGPPTQPVVPRARALDLGAARRRRVVAIQAMASLDDAQQACFFQFPAVPCPGGDDPRVVQLTFAFFGIPLVWLVGLVVAALAWALKRHGDRPDGHP